MRLKELRQEKELTQIDIAKGIDTSQRNISRWENGDNEPSSSFVIKLAKYFDVTTDYLLGIEDDFGNVVINKEAPQLTAEELKIIEDFRSLNFSGKKLVKQTLETLRATSEQSEQKKNKIS